jgi:predicted Zn-dependent protease
MSQINWIDVLGWGERELDDLRTVAYAYVQQGIYTTALTFLDAVVILNPPTAYDLQMLGAIHLQMGHGLKALDNLDRALRLDPSHIPTQLNRAKALFSLGYTQQAVAQARAVERQKDKDLASQATALIASASVDQKT